MRASAIIVAAGSGNRLAFGEPKAFVKLRAYAMLYYSLATLSQLPSIHEIVIACPAGMEKKAREEASRAGVTIPVKITPGGIERQDSVRIALALTSAETDVVVIHDAARPFADAALFSRCLETAARTGAAIAAIPVSDTLKRVADNAITATLKRTGLYQAQTPQAFQRRLLVAAHERALREHVIATDDADLVEQIGGTVEIVEASALNLKITTKADREIAEAIAAAIREK
ncbi:MAG TPA: 2-C-methyl-D-erythritol 4-phosphate cytidylyltransferase [Candidatus Binataceae bacterium]|nr:2-C-methyl-D-erythritol 4-phosphate cytidylyltransferase [Candidatus Binataceae bacterium]